MECYYIFISSACRSKQLISIMIPETNLSMLYKSALCLLNFDLCY